MKALVLFLSLAFPTFFLAQSTVDLQVKIGNIENNRGLIQLGLYNDASRFPKVGKTYKMVRVRTKGKDKLYTFKNLPIDRYLSLIHI